MLRLIAAVVAVCGLTVAGCGGGGAKTTQTPSKAAYIAKADAICEAEQAKRQELEKRVADLAPITAGETHEVAKLLREASDSLRAEVRGLRELGAPPEDDPSPASVLSILSDQIADLDGWADAYDDRSAVRIRRLQARIAEDSAKASAIAQHYGFQVCGKPGNGNTGNLTRFR